MVSSISLESQVFFAILIFTAKDHHLFLLWIYLCGFHPNKKEHHTSATERGSLFFFGEVEHLLMTPYCTDSNFFNNFMACLALGNSACTWAGRTVQISIIITCLNPRRGLTLLSQVCRDLAIGVWSQRNPEVPASTGDEALFQCTKPSGVPRGPSHLQFKNIHNNLVWILSLQHYIKNWHHIDPP